MKYNIGDRFVLEIIGIDDNGPKNSYDIKGLDKPFAETVLDKLHKIDEPKERWQDAVMRTFLSRS